MRPVWIIILLVLFSIVGIQGTFAEQASGKPIWETNSDKVCRSRLCSEIPLNQVKIPKIESPKKQMLRGIAVEDVLCKNGLELVIRTNGLAACVRSETAERMQKIGMLFTPTGFTKPEKEIEIVPASSTSIVNFYITDHDLNLAHRGVEVVSTEGLFEFTINGIPIEGPKSMIETGPDTGQFYVKLKLPETINGRPLSQDNIVLIKYLDESDFSGKQRVLVKSISLTKTFAKV